jgi:hypothetical protein
VPSNIHSDNSERSLSADELQSQRKIRKRSVNMNSDAAVDTTSTQTSTFLIRVDGFSSTRRREKCRVTFLDAETSSVVATRSFDSGFVRQASIRQLLNIISVEYRYRSHRVEQATRALHRTARRVSRALARNAQRQTLLKDSIGDGAAPNFKDSIGKAGPQISRIRLQCQ